MSVEISSGRFTRDQLPEQVAAYVRELIVSGEVRPGEFVRMEPITKAMGVSNTPVREGLLVLRNEGFVELVPRRGFVVAKFTRQDVRDLFWVQGMVAGELAARAAKIVTEEELADLSDLLDQYERAVNESAGDQVARLGHSFHRRINIAADSDRLTLLLGSVVKHLTNRFYAAIEGHVDATLQDHPAILDALRKRKPEEARRLMETHILAGADRLIASLEEQGLWTDDGEVKAAGRSVASVASANGRAPRRRTSG
ncbi:GntR family transcriptional regulator [Sporichthya sp.]|uniref:GntR family transcriptional regulator n=1 Tax=Sporichthya sp. TaxID=65475 RepID=UPI0025E3BE39|nr:GntR family transcriptional regulator [Sporichthya sp.]